MIVTDKNLALMNAVKTMFFVSHNLLCQFHIDKNVKAKCKQHVTPKKARDQVMEAWSTVMDCLTKSDHEDYLSKFEVLYEP